jgi:TolB protein
MKVKLFNFKTYKWLCLILLVTFSYLSGNFEVPIGASIKTTRALSLSKSGWIIFESNRGGNSDLYLVDSRGNNIRKLTQGKGNISDFDISDTEPKIAYVSDEDGEKNIYVIDIDNPQSIKRLTQFKSLIAGDKEGITNLEWSPNGKLISFLSDIDGTRSIYTIDESVNNLHNLETYAVGPLSWAPDGTRIVTNNGVYIFTLNVSNGNVFNLTQDNLPQRTSPVGNLQWSPIGHTMLFQSSYFDRNQQYTQLSLISDQGKDFQIIVKNKMYFDMDFAWSPNGQQIVFTSNMDKGSTMSAALYLVNADGSNLQQLTEDLPSIHRPSWSSDGQQIVFSAGGIYRDIYVVDVEGKNLRQLTDGKYFNDYPVWRPQPVTKS